jgi:type I restriction enzyme M protein
MTFDCVIANPPFSLKNWGEDLWASDRWGRNSAGTPPPSYGDWAWLQHMIASMAPGHGRLAVVLPLGALFRSQSEGRIRSKVLESDVIEAVIEIGPNLFYGTTIPACIVIARTHKAKERRKKVLFINANDLFRSGRNQNTLESEHIDQIFKLYQNFSDVDRFARVVTITEILDQGGDLSPGRFVSKQIAQEFPSIDVAMNQLREAALATQKTQTRLLKVLKDHGLS